MKIKKRSVKKKYVKAKVRSGHRSVDPKLENKVAKKVVKKVIKEEFMKTGIPGMDSLLGEGIPTGSSVLIEGGPGNGKTIMALSLIKSLCAQGKKVLYMSFEEPEDRLRMHLKSFGVDAEKHEKNGNLYLRRFNALDIARSVEALLSEAKKELLIDVQPILIPKEYHPDVVLIDSLSSISSAFSGESSRFRIYMEQLFRYLESNKITSFLIREVSNPTHVGTTYFESGEAVSFLSDGIVILYNVFQKNGVRKRALEILKLRGVNIKRRIVEFDIKKGKGLIVYPEKILKGDYSLT